jgi:tetratricopeptide (TPR) repeat protein
MKDHATILNGLCFNVRRSLRLLLGLALVLVLCVAVAHAQTDSNHQDAADEHGSSTPSVSNAKRARRVSPSPVENENPSAKNDSHPSEPESSADPTASPEASEAVVDSSETPASESGESHQTDRISTLRAKIKDAKNEAERSRLRRTLIDYLVALDQKDEAVDELHLMAQDERFDPAGFYNIGNALARLGDTDGAIEAYRKAIEQRRGNYSRAFNNLGVVQMRAGRLDQAYDSFTSALKLENYRYAEASYNLGRLYAARGETELAIREWSRALAVQSDHSDAALALARALAGAGDPERAIAILDAFTTRHGSNSEFEAARREILSGAAASGKKIRDTKTSGGANSPAKAGSSARTGAPKLSVDRETYDLLQAARAANEAGRYQDAVAAYQRLLARHGGYFAPANLELSYALIALKRNEEAMENLLAVTKRDGARYPIAYYHLGRLYESRGQLSLAAEAYNRAATADGDANPQAYLELSRVREKEGNLTAALSAMESYVRITKRNGSTPDWATARLAELRQKITASAEQSSTRKQ